MSYRDAREGKRMEWVASTLHTTSEHCVSSITTADAPTSAASSRLNWRPPADLNGLVRFAERRNLVSARVPSHFKRSLHSLVRGAATISLPHIFAWSLQGQIYLYLNKTYLLSKRLLSINLSEFRVRTLLMVLVLVLPITLTWPLCLIIEDGILESDRWGSQ